MSIDTILKKEGIENIRPLDTLTINRIAKSIADKLSTAFEEHNLEASDLFTQICRLNMYFARMPEDQSGAKYSYMNNAIYFNEKFNIDEILESAIHECIHYLQEIKDEKGNLIRMGLCNFQEDKNVGTAMNEAAVQFMAAEACKKQEDKVKYYDIFLSTKSPDYYPIECVLINEMVYFTGKYPLYHSTLHGDDVFKNTFSGKYGVNTYKTIQKNMETNDKKVSQINIQIKNTKEKIASIFFETQDYIMKNCFNKNFQETRTLEDLKYFKEDLYRFKDIIGYTESYSNYNNFYINKMNEFEIRKQKIENGELDFENVTNTELVDTSNKHYSFIRRILMKLGIISDINKENKWIYNKK